MPNQKERAGKANEALFFSQVQFNWSSDCFDTAAQVEFEKQVFKIQERQRAREEEIEGGWYTEERMSKDLGYSPTLDHNL